MNKRPSRVRKGKERKEGQPRLDSNQGENVVWGKEGGCRVHAGDDDDDDDVLGGSGCKDMVGQDWGGEGEMYPRCSMQSSIQTRDVQFS